jgi:thiamine-monophosphate kinase
MYAVTMTCLQGSGKESIIDVHGSEGKSEAAGARGVPVGDPAGETAADTLRDVGEFALIAAIRRRLPTGPGVLVGPGDDAAVVVAPDARVVVSTDVLVEGVHFRRDWSEPDDIGHRAAAASLADIAAMGASATALVVGLSTPPDLPLAFALRLADGLRDEAGLVAATVVGGDVVSSPTLSICVTALGDLQGRSPVTRAGAQPGDVVAVCGRLGWAQAGLTVLRRGFGSPRAVVAAHRRPQPPYAAGVAAAEAGATSMIDVSDGLLADLGHVAAASGVSIVLDGDRLSPDPQLLEVASAFGSDALDWVLSGGDDHALVATFAARSAVPEGFRVIGRALEAGDRLDEQPNVEVSGYQVPGRRGHEHFA